MMLHILKQRIGLAHNLDLKPWCTSKGAGVGVGQILLTHAQQINNLSFKPKGQQSNEFFKFQFEKNIPS
jgi:hypothetical protein